MHHHSNFRNASRPAFDIIDELINAARSQQDRARPFPVQIFETAQAYIVRAALPGFAKDQIKIEVDGNVLTLSAQREATPAIEGATLIAGEGFPEKARRVLTLPQEVDAAGATAKFDLGVLEASFPKFAPSKREVRVE